MSAKTSLEMSAEAAMKSSTSTAPFRVTVLRSRNTSRVLFLEAGKDFVDTLFSFLLLPVGTIIHILSKGGQGKPLNGISSIFKSVEKLDSSLLRVDRTHLVEPRPTAASMCASTIRLLGIEAQKMESPPQKRTVPSLYYMCTSFSLISSMYGARCATCTGYRYTYTRGTYTVCAEDVQNQESSWEQAVSVEDDSSTAQGFVKKSTSYLVTDKLEIMPATTIRSITVLNELEVGNIADLESTDITITITQVTHQVLDDVILAIYVISSSCTKASISRLVTKFETVCYGVLDVIEAESVIDIMTLQENEASNDILK